MLMKNKKIGDGNFGGADRYDGCRLNINRVEVNCIELTVK